MLFRDQNTRLSRSPKQVINSPYSHVCYPPYLEGTSQPDAQSIKLPRYEVRIDSARAKSDRAHARKNTVSLYTAPTKTTGIPNAMRVGPNARIEFLDAVEDNGNELWLHLRIDGNEGYIARDDFEAVGLPAAG